MFRLKRLGVLRQTIRCFRACKINHLHFFTIVILPENEGLGVKFRVTMKRMNTEHRIVTTSL